MGVQGRWKCGMCGRFSPHVEKNCTVCGVSRESDSVVLDTRSFFIPARKRAMWVWIAVSLALPAIMSGVYMLMKHLFK